MTELRTLLVEKRLLIACHADDAAVDMLRIINGSRDLTSIMG